MESSTWKPQRSGLLIKLRTHLCELLQELQNLKNYEANAPVVIIGFGPMGQVICTFLESCFSSFSFAIKLTGVTLLQSLSMTDESEDFCILVWEGSCEFSIHSISSRSWGWFSWLALCCIWSWSRASEGNKKGASSLGVLNIETTTEKKQKHYRPSPPQTASSSVSAFLCCVAVIWKQNLLLITGST